MSATGPTFTIGGVDCPAVWMNDFRFQDWALVREITGLDKEAFVHAHNDGTEAPPDPLVLYGYAAVSWWHRNPLLNRERMAIEASDWTEQQIVLRMPEVEGDVPLDVVEEESGSSSSSESSSTSEPSSESVAA